MADVNFFKNKTVLVTGGCSGLSKAIAIELIMNKTDVVLIASKKEEIAAINNELSTTKKKIGKFIGVIGETTSSKTTKDTITDFFFCDASQFSIASFIRLITVSASS